MHPFPTWMTQFENATQTLLCARAGGGAQASQGLRPTAALVHKRVTNEDHLNHVIDKRDY